jgi:NADH dehydrogenase
MRTRGGKTAAENLAYEIEGQPGKKKKFSYKGRGMMAEIGSRNGIALVFGLKFRGFIAWCLWRMFYLNNLPTAKKKMTVISDWTMDLFYKPDASMIKRSQSEEKILAKRGSEEKEEDIIG